MNVLIALAWPNHLHHLAARTWFSTSRDQGWATCANTQIGFVRLAANPKVTGGTVTAPDALALLKRLSGLGAHHFLADDVDLLVSDDAAWIESMATGR
ncbi:MAG: hypothetical protein ACR2MB_03410 [Acidimicrobiales bacterium]